MTRITFPQARLALATLVVAVLSACGSAPHVTNPPPVVATHTVQGASSMPLYRKQAAQAITQASSTFVYAGAPPNPVRAVVVLDYLVDRTGRVGTITTIRFPDHAPSYFLDIAQNSIRAANPLPAPGGALASKGSVTVRETFLFNEDGRFQLLSLSSGQAEPSAD